MGRGGRGRGARGARRTAPLVALLLALVAAGTLLAHGALRRSTPAAGSRVASPAALRLEFTEAAELAATHVELDGPGGTDVPLGPLRHPGDSATVVTAAVGRPLEPGLYTVRWQVTGRDGHPVRGRFAFTVVAGASDRMVRAAPDSTVGGVAGAPGVAAGAGGPPRQQSGPDSAEHRHQESAPPTDRAASPAGSLAAFDTESIAYVALRWLSYIALLAGIGAVVMARIARSSGTSGARHNTQARLAAVGLAAAWIGIGLTVARLFAQSVAVHGADSAMSPTLLGPLVGSSTWGRAWIVQLLAGMLAAAGFTMVVARPERRGGWRLAAVAALGAALGTALGGHASAAEGWRWGVLVVGDALHVLGAGAWIGGVLMLAVAVLPRASAPDAANVVRGFSPWALGGAGTLAATGLLAAWSHMPEPLAPWETRYGRILLVKLALVAAIVALGAINWRRLGPRAARPAGNAALRRSVWLEAVVALGVLGATAVLVAVSPLE